MKMYKKVMAAALAGVMTVSMSATAFAADDDGYILKATNEDSKSSDNDLVIACLLYTSLLLHTMIQYRRDLVLTIICPVPRSSWNFADISKNTDHAEQWNSYGLVQKRKVCLEVGTILKNMKQNFRLIVSI